MLYVIIWLLCGIVAAVIYQNKGRSGVAAFAIGVLLGPIGVILAALTPASAAGQEQQALARGDMKKCPQCGELVRSEAQVCRFCQYAFPAPAPLAPGQVVKITTGGVTRCSNCNGAVRAEATLCKHCKQTFTR